MRLLVLVLAACAPVQHDTVLPSPAGTRDSEADDTDDTDRVDTGDTADPGETDEPPADRDRVEGAFEAGGLATVYRGGEARALAGYDAARAGDVDGDGRDDVWVEAFDTDGAASAYLVPGSVDGDHVLADVALTRVWTSYETSFQLAGGDDLDGDGVPDLVVGVPGISKVYVATGSMLGEVEIHDTAAVVRMGSVLHERVGNVVSTSPDLTGDGVGDLIVGSLGTTEGCAAWIFPGPVAGDHTLDEAIAIGSDEVASYPGRGLGGLGDVNGDGAADLVVGDIGLDVDGPGGSGAAIFYGPVTADAHVWDGDRIVVGEREDDWMGQGATDARGDLDGDGLDDIVLTAPYYGGYTGAIYVVAGSPTAAGVESAGAATARIYGAPANAHVGAGHDLLDLDGDGVDDLVVPSDDADPDVLGKILVFYGPLAGAYEASSPDARLTAATAGLAGAVSVGDTNADGFDDLVLGSPADSTNGLYAGAAWLFR